MIHRFLTYEVRTEALPQAQALARAFVDEVVRKEGGTAKYQAFQHVDPPTRFTHLMSFRTPSAEEYHRKTAWNKRFTEALAPLCARPPQAADLTLLAPA